MMPTDPAMSEPSVPEATESASARDSKFFTDVLKLVSGSGFVQAFRVLISPVLSRLFLPEYFGVLQNFLSISKPLGIISSLRYDRAILLPKDRDEAANMLVLSFGITLIFSTVLLGAVALYGQTVARALNSPELADYLWFVPFFVAALGIFESLRQWNSRERKYMRLSIAQVGSEVLGDGLTAGFGFAGFASGSIMILMQVLGQFFATIAFGFLVFKEDLKYILGQLDWATMRAGLVKYKKLPMFNLWGNLIANAALYIPGILLSMYFSPTVAGFYAMGNNAIRLPVSVVGNSIGQVFYQRCARAYHEGGVKQIVEGTLKHLIVFSLFPMLLISIIGKELFVIAFGARWLEAGQYSQILSLWVFFVFITVPISYIPNIFDRNEKFLVFQLFNLATRVGSLVYGGLRGDVWLALWLFSASGVLVYAAMLVWMTGLAGVSVRQLLRYLARGLFSSLPFLLAVLAFKLWNPVPAVTISALKLPLDGLALLAVALMAGILYYWLYLQRDPSMREEVKRVLGILRPNKPA